jgi:polysaccharide pyruvyl transferase WcaK-like protein
VTIHSGAGWTNLGDDALTLAIVRAVHKLDTEVGIAVAGGRFAPALIEDSTMPFIPLGNRRMRDRARFVTAVGRSSLVIVGGGGLLHDRLPRFYQPFIRTIHLARSLRRPTLLYGVGVHEPTTRDFETELRALGRMGVAVTVRDERSREILQAFGVRAEVVLDPAFALDWPAIAGPDEGAWPTSRRLIVNVRPWWHRTEIPGGFDPALSAALFDSITGAIESFEPDEVTLLGLSTFGDDDRAPLARLERHLAGVCRVSLQTPRTIEALAGIYARGTGSIVMRLHAAIFSAVSRTPTVAIAYDEKVRTVLDPIQRVVKVLDIDDVRAETVHQALKVVTSQPAPSLDELSQRAASQLAHYVRECAI